MNTRLCSFSFLAAFGIFVLYLSHYVFMGENLYIPIHDNFDLGHSWLTLFTSHSDWLGNRDAYLREHYWMLPSSSYPPTLSLITWSYRILSPLTAYIFNTSLVHIIAFFGAYFFIKNHVANKNESEGHKFIPWCALCFAILPFSTFMTASITSIPLFFNSFFNIRKRQAQASDWLILLAIPFYSSLALSYIYVFPFVLGLLIYDFKNKRPTLLALIAAMVTGLLFLVTESSQIFGFLLNSSFHSHRIEFIRESSSFSESFITFAKLLLLGHYHAASKHTLTLIFISVFVLYSLLKNKKWPLDRMLSTLCLTIIAICTFGGFFRFHMFYDLIGQSSVFKVFNFERLYILLPFLWTIALAKLCFSFLRSGKRSWAITILTANCFYLITQVDTVQAYKETHITYSQYFSETLFKEVRSYLDAKGTAYDTLNIGFEPAISIFNELPTKDFYTVNYDIQYKKDFRFLIEAELAKKDSLRKYFDDWGSRVYLFSSDLFTSCFTLCTKDNNLNVSFDISKEGKFRLKNTYLLSSVFLSNPDFELEKSFEEPSSPWAIHVYRLKENAD